MRRYLLFVASSVAIGIIETSSSVSTTPREPQSASRVSSYSNPVLQGDFPDPSVIRVGRDYWATATTS
jgi:xylan 1,4-beta-xylosidase